MARKPTDIATLSLRIREELRRQIEREAKRQDRSLNSEIVRRLENSLSDDKDAESLRAVLGDRTGGFIRAIMTAIWLVEKQTGKRWHEDRETGDRAYLTIMDIFNSFMRGSLDPARALLLKREDEPTAEVLAKLPEEWRKFAKTSAAAKAAALETLQKMGMAPSDAEIEEFAKKHAQAAEVPSVLLSSLHQPIKPGEEPK